MAIPDIKIPTLTSISLPPGPTRNMGMPVTDGIKPPVATPPSYPTGGLLYPMPPISNPDPGEPNPGLIGQEEVATQEEEDSREMPETVDIPMAPFDASTSIEFTIPVIEKPVEIPVPKPEVVITAGTTAAVATVGATAAAVFAKPLFDLVLKHLKTVMKKVMKTVMQKKDVVYPEAQSLQLPDQFQFSKHRPSPALSRQHREQRKGKQGSEKPLPE